MPVLSKGIRLNKNNRASFMKELEEKSFSVNWPYWAGILDGDGCLGKKEMAFPKTGDHVIASSITSKDWQTVLFQTINFLENVTQIPANPAYQEQVEQMTKATQLLDSIPLKKNN